MKLNNATWMLLLVLIFSALSSCGGGGGTPSEINLSESAEADSYLPLTPGIKIKFSDGLKGENSSILVEGLVVNVLEGGVVNITGRRISTEDEEYCDVDENLTFNEDGNQILLARYSLDYTCSNGETFHNNRIYNPPVVFLEDRNILTDGSYKDTEHLTVEYEGEPEEMIHYSNVDSYTFYVAGYENVTATVIYEKTQENLLLGDVDVECYDVAFQWDMLTMAVWYPLGGLVNGNLKLAKGMGIVGVAGQIAIETNVN